MAAQLVRILTTTDHKVIGNLYFVVTMLWFCLGGLMALLIRAELFAPGMQVVPNPIICMRAPGMTMFRMPIFFGMAADPIFGWHVFDPAHGGAMLWQHLFWFFGHPEVYIVALPFFGIMTMLIAVPTGVTFFNWVGTMWRGSLSLETPMLFALGFLVIFLFGGLTGVILASPALDWHVTDTYFVVAHLHYVVFGTVVFAMFAGSPVSSSPGR